MPGLPVSNAAVLSIIPLMSLALFFNGLRFARMATNSWAGKSFLGQPIEGGEMPIERVRLLGKVQMAAAPVFFLLFAGAILFGGVTFRA
jgi:hypothetical protein